MKGIITKIIYKRANICIFVLDGEISIKTEISIDLCEENNYVEIIGKEEVSPNYGHQIKASNIKLLPKPSNILFNFIEKNIKGVGKQTIAKIKKEYPNNFLEIGLKEPEKLKKIINNQSRYEKIIDFLKEEREKILKYEELDKYNIPTVIMKKLEKKHTPENIIEVIKNNPYRFIKYFDCKIYLLDNLAEKHHSNYRKEGLIWKKILEIYKKKGYAFKPEKEELDFIANFDEKYKIGKISIYNDLILISKYNFYENNICKIFKNLSKFQIKIENFETEELNLEQNNYINLAIKEPISILTGGPGTGKSRTIKFVVKSLLKLYHKSSIMLSSLTGVATNNIKNIVGNIQGSTLHKIKYKHQGCCFEPNEKFCDCESCQINFNIKVLIIDELSMADIKTFSHVLSKLPNLQKLILVGDPNQLPSISAGQLLIDLLDAKIPNICLKTIYRQEKNNSIISNAYKILLGDLDLIFDKECMIFSDISGEIIIKNYDENTHIITLTKEKSKKINNYLQKNMNKNPLITIKAECIRFIEKEGKTKKKTIYENFYFKLNDKVKHTKNNYDLEVFNGEIGFIIKINEEMLTVKYSDREVNYSGQNLEQLILAYSTTIHSMQGNEFDNVIIFINDCNFLLNKNVFYTALTRAKKKATIIGSKNQLRMAIKKNYEKRNTILAYKLKQSY